MSSQDQLSFIMLQSVVYFDQLSGAARKICKVFIESISMLLNQPQRKLGQSCTNRKMAPLVRLYMLGQVSLNDGTQICSIHITTNPNYFCVTFWCFIFQSLHGWSLRIYRRPVIHSSLTNITDITQIIVDNSQLHRTSEMQDNSMVPVASRIELQSTDAATGPRPVNPPTSAR